MKRRILSLVLMATMLLGVTACGGGEQKPEATKVATKATEDKAGNAFDWLPENLVDEIKEAASTAQTTARTEADVEDTTTTTTTAEPIPEISEFEITRSIFFRNGSWVFKAYGENSLERFEKNFLYNIADNKLIEIEEDDYIRDIYDICGNAILCEVDDKVVLYDAETAEVSANFTEEGVNLNRIDDYYFYNNFLILTKLEKSFSGNTGYFGVMNSKGEYTVDLTANHKVFGTHKNQWGYENDFSSDNAQYTYYFRSWCDGVIQITEDNYYSIANDTFLSCEDLEKVLDISADGSYNGYKVFHIDNDTIYYWIYDNDARDYVYKKYNTAAKSTSIMKQPPNAVSNEGNYLYCDYITDKVANFDLSKYTDRLNVYEASEDNIFFGTRQNGDFYLCVMDAKGEFGFEPFIGNANIDYTFYKDGCFLSMYNSVFVYNTATKSLFQPNYDYDSEDYMGFEMYNEDTNTILVKTKNADGEYIYSLMNGANAGTLINPLATSTTE